MLMWDNFLAIISAQSIGASPRRSAAVHRFVGGRQGHSGIQVFPVVLGHLGVALCGSHRHKAFVITRLARRVGL